MYSNVGKRSIESMFANATEDFISSERATKNLRLTRRSRFAEYTIELWYRRLNAFRKYTLGIDDADSTTPTGEEIERFISIISRHLKPKGGGVICVSTIRSGIDHLLKGCVFYHPDFKVTAHEGSRIQSLVHTLVRNGTLTTNLKVERQWIGSVLVAKLVDSTYRDALCNGTISWDLTLAKIQSIVLHAALGCRVGDIATSRYDDHHLPYLAYGDITMKLDGGSGVENLCMLVLMRNIKGRKGIPSLNSTKRFYSINSPLESIPLCPVKVIVIMALRFGNVTDVNSIEELLLTTARRDDKTVQWKDPRRPILPSFTSGHVVLPNKPAHSSQFNATLAEISVRAGIVARITGHDLRRGSAQDIAAAAAKGMVPPLLHAEFAAKELLSHGYDTMFSGVTKRYIGPDQHDLWVPRVENKYTDVFTTPRVAEVNIPIIQARQLPSEAVDTFCETYGLDPTKRSERLKATRKAKKAALDEWIRENRSGEETPDGDTREEGAFATNLPISEETSTTAFHSVDTSDTSPFVPADIVTLDSYTVDTSDTSLFILEDTAPAVFNDEQCDADDSNGCVSILSSIMNNEEASEDAHEHDTEAMAMDMLLEVVSASQADQTPSETPLPSQTGQPSLEQFPTLNPLEFVQQFSSINVIHNSSICMPASSSFEDLLSTMNGNSRNNSSLFLLFCKYRETKGCMHSAPRRLNMDLHEKRCAKQQPKLPKPPKGPPKKAGPEMSTLLCPKESCGKKFSTVSNLLRHVKEHDWVNVPCPHKCDDEKLYSSRSKLDAHMQQEHKNDFNLTCCPVQGCKSARKFKSFLVLEEHFTKAHGKMSREEVQRLIAGTQERVDDSDALDDE